MTTKEPAPQAAPLAPSAPTPAVEVAITTDEHAGCGGSYVFDPKTGKRTPAEPA